MSGVKTEQYNVTLSCWEGKEYEVGMFDTEPTDGLPCGETWGGKQCGKTDSPHFCEPRVRDVLDFWCRLRLVNPPDTGKPFKLYKWMEQLVARLFGVVVWEERLNRDGEPEKQQWVRRYRHLYLIVGRGNSKSTLIAGIMLYLLSVFPPRSTLVAAAQTQESTSTQIGGLIYDMALQSDTGYKLKTRSKPEGLERTSDERAGKTQVIYLPPSKPDSPRGYRIMACALDEFAFYPYLSEFVSQVRKTWGHYPEPLLLMTSTPSTEPGSYERITTELAKATMENPSRNPRMLPVVYGADKDDDLGAKETWLKCNPMLAEGVIDMAVLEDEWVASEEDPIARNEFYRERLGLPMELVSSYIPAKVWRENRGDKTGLETVNEVRDRLKNMRVFVGCDFSETSDMSSMGVVGYEDGHLLVTSYSWIPKTGYAQLNKQLQGLPARWVDDGMLSIVEDGAAGTAQVAKEMVAAMKPYNVALVGYDVALAQRAAKVIIKAGYKVLKVPQGQHLHEAIGEMKALAKDRRVAHGGDPVLGYAVEGAEVKLSDQEKKQLVKPKRRVSAWRIDALVATVTAIQTQIEYERSSSRGHPVVVGYDDVDGW